MKISWFYAFLSLIVAGALAWLAYDIAEDEKNNLDILVAIGTGITVLITLGGAIALRLENSRVSINQRVWSGVMFVAILVANFCFAGFGVKMPWYPVIIACLLVIHLGVARSIANVKDV